MPYIDKSYREELDSLIDSFAEKVKEIHAKTPAQTRDGLLNYSLTRILNNVYANARYTDYNELIGMLECCKLEYYRKKIGPYEDIKAEANGEVDTFDTKKDPEAY